MCVVQVEGNPGELAAKDRRQMQALSVTLQNIFVPDRGFTRLRWVVNRHAGNVHRGSGRLVDYKNGVQGT